MTLLEIEQRRSRRAKRKHRKQVARKKRLSETEQQRTERLEKAAAERRQLRQRLAEDDDAVLTFKEWCALNSISEREGRRILAGEIAGDNGPIVTMLSDRRIGISRRNNRAWQEARERG